jgi:hypothetical protein
MKIFEIFENEPIQWGLRGDPYLWREMKEHLREVEMPESMNKLKVILEKTYEELTNHPLSFQDDFIVERFKHGGMSSGGISPRFWINKGIPLLLKRHKKP